ncbi:hypothetical protein AWN76_006210 [Rhodothermaceae bacterium RA]|nr:hypothetical protein AWN76_006210 [Rhodothermaceae bacterium RA]
MLRRFALAVSVVCFLAACGGGEPPASPDAPIAVTSIPVEGTAAADFIPRLDGPLRLLSITPNGPLSVRPPDLVVSVTFSKPMVPLGETPAVPPQTLTLDPAVPGTLRWEGTQTLLFVPDAPLPRATAFRARLAGGLTAVDGDTWTDGATWTFETPRPAVVASDPPDGARYVAPTSPVWLRFNQRIDTTRAAEHLRLYVRDDRGERGERIPTEVRFEADTAAVVRPVAPLSAGTGYVLVVTPGLRGVEGPLPSEDEQTVGFRTYEPLRLVEVSQPRSWDERDQEALAPDRGIALTFTTPVRFEALRQAVSFRPAVALPPGIEARDAVVSTSHVLPVTLRPETAYTVRIDSLEDAFGQVLASAQASFRTRAFTPTASMPQGLMVIEADQEPALPLRATNIDRVFVGARRLAADEIIPVLRAYDSQHYYGYQPRNEQPRPVPADRPWLLDLERNEPGIRPLRLDTLLTDGTGVVGVHLRVPEAGTQPARSYTALAQMTRLGLTAKFSAHQNLLFVTDLRTAAPVPNARVTLRDADNTVRWTGTTDATGRATTPGWHALGLIAPSAWDRPVQYAFVEHEGDLAFTSSLYDDGLEPYRFDVPFAWWPQPVTYAGSVFSDRGLYRTGETVHLKGILRRRQDRDWAAVTDSIRVFIRDPRDQVVLDRRLRPSDLGTFHLDWTAPAGAAQGPYGVRVILAADTAAAAEDYYGPGDLAAGTFRVDAFRRATFAVEATSLAPGYVAGDFFEGTISGRYLFGAAMQGQPVSYRLQRVSGSYRPPGFDGYTFGVYRYIDGLFQDLVRADTVLDENGRLRVRRPLPGNTHGIPTRIVWEGTVTDPARQQATARTEVVLHPGLYYIGLKTGTRYVDLSEDQTMLVDLLTTTPGGHVLGDRPVEVTLIRQQWNSVREVGADGRLRWRSERVEEVVASQPVRTEAGRALRLELPVRQGGSYIVRATSRDLRGNTIATEAYFYAAGPGYTAWERRDDDRIELIPDRDRYRPGETARIMVLSPYEEATALITVEREGILSSRVETLVGSAPQVEIPLDEAHLPNAFVSVVLLNGRTAAPTATHDAGAPGFKIGYANLRVDPGVRHLRVEIEPDASTYRPGDEVSVELRLVDAAGRGVPGEIAFSAADAGVLDLIGYALPDPFEVFYGPRSLGVTTAESRANLVRQRNYGQKEEDLGGGGGDPASQLRRDFRPLAHWAPALQTDERGRARVTFRLPESLTTFRLMAAALTADHRFGAGRTDITVTQPLVLQPALPRFARLEDRFEAGVLVTNTTGAPGTATVTAAATGLLLEGPATRTVPLQHGETREVRFAWVADAAGDAALTFSAELGRDRDALEVTLPVLIPTTTRTWATFAATSDTAREAVVMPEAFEPDLGGLDVRLAGTALVGLDGAAEYLLTYPYGCLEQRTSAVRPLLLADDLLDAFDLDALGGDRTAVVERWLHDLDGFWTGDGFALWPGGRHTSPYVSAYVVLALAEAEAAGFTVPSTLRAEAVRALEESVRNRSRRPDYYAPRVWDDTRALMLYALARHGRLLPSEIDDLARRERDDPSTLSVDGESFLIRTLLHADAPALRTHLAPLTDRLQRRIRVEATTAYLTAPTEADYGWIFASDVRATAFGLTALLAADPSDERRLVAQRMVQYLMQQRRSGAWASTQDNAAVIDAFRAYHEAFEAVEPAFSAEVRAAGQTILTASFQGHRLATAETTVPLGALPDATRVPLTIRKDGPGLLYYTLRLQTYTTAPLPAAAQGLTVERRLQRLDDAGRPVGSPWTTGEAPLSLRSGEMVRVLLRVTSPTDRNYVVVDDALPAGLEALNTAFETTDRAAVETARQDVRERWWGSFNHTEIRDDRVVLFADYLTRGEHTYVYVARATTPGTFTHPPVQAALMYRPETNGRTATGTLVVEPPAEGTASR